MQVPVADRFGPPSLPGRLLEAAGNCRPREMAVHDKTRLTGPLRPFLRMRDEG